MYSHSPVKCACRSLYIQLNLSWLKQNKCAYCGALRAVIPVKQVISRIAHVLTKLTTFCPLWFAIPRGNPSIRYRSSHGNWRCRHWWECKCCSDHCGVLLSLRTLPSWQAWESIQGLSSRSHATYWRHSVFSPWIRLSRILRGLAYKVSSLT